MVDSGRIKIRLVVQIVQHLMKTKHDKDDIGNGVVDYRVTCRTIV